MFTIVIAIAFSITVIPKVIAYPISNLLGDVSLSNITGYIRDLEGFGSRDSRRDGCDKAANYIEKLFDNWGLNGELKNYPNPANYTPNVIGTLMGRTTPERIYIASAHFDSSANFTLGGIGRLILHLGQMIMQVELLLY
jgi:hypothetical protein